MRRLAGLIPVVLFGCSSSGFTPSHPKPRVFGAPVTVCQISDARVAESSGLAPSLTRTGVWYTHNDSGDGPVFYSFDAKGKILERYEVEGAKAVDWEDMASTRINGQDYLYFGDIGDNLDRREEIVVYRVREPKAGGGKVPLNQAIHLRYPDGPHNAEALIVDPTTAKICIVVKTSDEQANVYVAPPEGGTLQKIGAVSIGGFIKESRKVTGGSISPDGKHVVLRTYMSAYEYTVGDTFESWPDSKPTKIKTNLDFQGEGIAYARDGKSVWTSSEMSPSQISRIPLL